MIKIHLFFNFYKKKNFYFLKLKKIKKFLILKFINEDYK